MDATAHYRNLVALGREEFLAVAAPAVLVRYRTAADDLAEGITTLTLDQDAAGAALQDPPTGEPALDLSGTTPFQVFPLSKKPGASFPDRITLGRTANNDVEVPDPSVSRLHAYVRQDRGAWVVADAGSKNGSWLDNRKLEPRKEMKLSSKSVLRIGDVDLTFYVAADLFAALGGA